MLVGTLVVQAYLPGASSLKEKRKVVKSVTTKIQNQFNVAVVEIDNENLWQRAKIGVAAAGDSREYIERQLQLVLNFMDSEPRWEITDVAREWR
ncbi:MAG TPA: DUF503 domain-containing protein [Firmicutes bacterium]|nr:DUF503 domain-containing protein [Bacillota bacterium]